MDLGAESLSKLDKIKKSRYIMRCGACTRLLEYVDDIAHAKKAGIQRKCMRCKAMNCTSPETIEFKGSFTYVLAAFKDRITGDFYKGGAYVVRNPR